MTEPQLVRAVLDRRPFRTARRGDGTLLADYFDGHRLLADPALLAALAARLCAMVRACGATHVAGEVSAGSSLAVAVSLASLNTGRALQACGVRRRPKPYGVSGRLTTPVPAGTRFAVVDDVAGTGEALVRTVLALGEAGHQVRGTFVVLDREQGAADAVAAQGLTLASLFRISDLSTGDGRARDV